jgi:hypothetical protein
MRIARTYPRFSFDIEAIDDAAVYLDAAIGLSIDTDVGTAVDLLIEGIHTVLLRDLSASTGDARGVTGVPSCESVHLNTDAFVRYLNCRLLGLVKTDALK